MKFSLEKKIGVVYLKTGIHENYLRKARNLCLLLITQFTLETLTFGLPIRTRGPSKVKIITSLHYTYLRRMVH